MVAVSTIGGALIGSSASRSASSAQSDAANQSNATQQRMYDQTRADNAPWRQAGSTALGQLGSLTQLPESDPNSMLHKFTTDDLKNGLSPNYDFRLQQGQAATNNAASVSGGLVGGNALKGLQDYTQGVAGDAYQQAFNNYTGQQTNIFNRLSNIAGLGQTANQTTGNAGMNAANGISSAQLYSGSAQAAGAYGSGNAFSGGLNNLSSMYQMNKYMTSPTSMAGGGGGNPYFNSNGSANTELFGAQ